MTKKQIRLLVGVFTLFLGVLYSQFGTQLDKFLPEDIKGVFTTPTPSPYPYIQTAVVNEVIDGDTIQIDSGQTVRYIGIDTPETKHPTKGVECFGQESSDANKKLIQGKKVRLIKDVSETDRYGRLLRYVYVQPTATSESEIFVNGYLVEEGYAHVSTFPPDVKYSKYFSDLQKQAIENKKGLWSNCY